MILFDIFDPHLLFRKNLIEASAGTGKTYSIALIFLRLIVEKQVPLPRILGVTFTNAATEEMKERIRAFIRTAMRSLQGMTGENSHIDHIMTAACEKRSTQELLDDLNQALLDFDNAAIYTIHSFCQRVITEHAFECQTRFDMTLKHDQKAGIQAAAEDFFRTRLYPAEPVIADYVATKKITPALFAKIAANHISNPFITVRYPETRVTPMSIQARETERLQAFEHCRTLWRHQRDEIAAIFREHGESLHGGTYKPDTIESARQAADQVFKNTARPSVVLPKNLEKMTETMLQNKIKKGKYFPNHAFFSALDTFVELTRQISVLCATFFDGLKGEALEVIRTALDRQKAEQNWCSFDDLILILHTTLHGPNCERLQQAIRDRYQAVLIDEFQDTDAVQFDIFTRLFAEYNRLDSDVHQPRTILFFIGDPKQAIYSFRGADIFAYLDARNSRHVNEDRRYTMSVNYRTTPRLIAAVNHLFMNRPNPFLYQEIPMTGVSSAPVNAEKQYTESGQDVDPMVIWYLATEGLGKGKGFISKDLAVDRFVKGCAVEIRRILDPQTRACINGRAVTASDICVLARSRFEARRMKDILGRYQIPAVLSKADNVFYSHEAQELYTVLAAIADSGNPATLRAALITDFFGYSIESILALNNTEAELERLIETFRGYFRLWNRRRFLLMLNTLFNDFDVLARLLTLPDGDRRVTNLRHLAELLHTECETQKLKVTGVLNYLALSLEETAEDSERCELRMDSDEDAVKLITIHRSKGLEFPIVFCPFLWNPALGIRQKPDAVTYHSEKHLVLDVNSDDDEALQRHEEELQAENIRLAYVALTRAKYRCYIAWSRINKAGTSALAWLFHGFRDNKEYDALSDADIQADLHRLTACGAIAVAPVPHETTINPLPKTLPAVLVPNRSVSRVLPAPWTVTSFTSLLAGTPSYYDVELKDLDSDSDSGDKRSNIPTIHSLPKGSNTGSALHEILELWRGDKEALGEQVLATLTKYRINQDTVWTDCVTAMILRLIQTPLVPDTPGLTLDAVPFESRLVELEFYFSVQALAAGALAGVTQGKVQAPTTAIQGFLKGFIDLIFEYEGRFYILDWKSNWLGPDETAYHPAALDAAIHHHYYYIQYYIYIVAVVKYLASRKQDFDYDVHFGGVIYVFLRGVEHPESAGVFFDRPDREIVTRWEQLLVGDVSGCLAGRA